MQALVWLLLIDFSCAMDDILSLYLDQGLHPFQVAFVRFVVNALSVLPWMLPRGLFYFRMAQPMMHFWRAALGAIAIGCGTIAIMKMPLVQNTFLTFTESLFFLPLGAIFLKEHVTKQRVICSVLGLFGVIFITYQDISLSNFWILLPLMSAFFFAGTTTIARKMADDEPLQTLLFYFGLVSGLIFLIPALLVWKPLCWKQLMLLTALGVCGNLIQVFMFRAFQCAEISAFMPLRYMEAIMTFTLGYLIFHQIPPRTTWLGGSIIVLAALFITRTERRNDRVGPVSPEVREEAGHMKRRLGV